jgi:hypothetical protein
VWCVYKRNNFIRLALEETKWTRGEFKADFFCLDNASLLAAVNILGEMNKE